MKHLKSFESEQYTQMDIIRYKMTYAVAGKAWNTLWKKHKFHYPGRKFANIIITLEYDEDEDLGRFEILRYSKNDKNYTILGSKFFRGIPEDRIKFIQWLEELYLINNKKQ